MDVIYPFCLFVTTLLAFSLFRPRLATRRGLAIYTAIVLAALIGVLFELKFEGGQWEPLHGTAAILLAMAGFMEFAGILYFLKGTTGLVHYVVILMMMAGVMLIPKVFLMIQMVSRY